jgi:dolichol-phosphate mannosyltransferase
MVSEDHLDYREGTTAMRFLTAIPVFNEERHLERVLREIRRYSPHIVVINDGSTDGTGRLLAELAQSWASGDPDASLTVITHPQNRGYGAALISAFDYVRAHPQYDVLVTMDCDGQHEPARIPVLLEAIHDTDIVSGSRYLRDFRQDTAPPADRLAINQRVTHELNERFGLHLTDAFCGFKAYRREALDRLWPTETGWGMPLQLWVQAVRQGLRMKEIGVPRLYLDPNRAFGGVLNDAEERLAYYRRVIDEADAATVLCHCLREGWGGTAELPAVPVPGAEGGVTESKESCR